MQSRVRLTLLLALVGVGSCLLNPPPDDVAPALAPDPEFRIGVRVNVAKASLSGLGGLRVLDDEEGVVEELAPGALLEATTRGQGVTVRGGAAPVSRRLIRIEPLDSGGTIRLDGRDYRGALELRRGESGLTVVNLIGLELYLQGVVGAEMGRRLPGEEEALKAQAVVSRTFAVRNQKLGRDRAFDLAADVSAQVYAGMVNEDPLVIAAVKATRGEVLTYNGEPIDAFFSSTCGGRTEAGAAVFAGADRPYLQSLPDVDGNGVAWCASSPRYQWHEEWAGKAFTNTLRRTLAAEGLSTARASDLREIRVVDHTRSGRIATLELVGSGGRTTVSGQAIRRVLSPPAGGWLRSTDFTVRLSRSGSRIEAATIEGHGYGHGVGMCQWGAIGRARGGQPYGEILMSYFPGTELQRIY
jgi:stage II sporulation protein D